MEKRWTFAGFLTTVLILSTLLSAILLPIQEVEAHVVTTNIPVSADSLVSEYSKDDNYGSLTYVIVQGGYPRYRVYAKIDLAPLTNKGAHVIIKSAKLYYYCSMCHNSPVNIQAYFVSSDSWGETTITWNNAPAYGAWMSTRTVNGAGWYYWDVTPQAVTEHAGDDVMSILFRVTDEGISQDAYFASKDNSSNKPYLAVTYIHDSRKYLEAPLSIGDALLNQTLTTYSPATSELPYGEASISANLYTIDKDPASGANYEFDIAVVAAANSRCKMEYSTAYAWNLITDPPNTLVLGDNEGERVSTEGNWINYYGAWYDEVFIASNGFIVLDPNAYNDHGGKYTSPIPKPIPSTDDPNVLIAPFWRDLDPSAGGTIKYGFVNYAGWYGWGVKWINVKNRANPNTQTFAVFISNPDTRGVSHLAFLYGTITNDISTSIGIEDHTGKRGVSIPSVTSGRSIDFTPTIPDNNIGINNIKISASKLKDDGANDDKASILVNGMGLNPYPGGTNVQLYDPSQGQYQQFPVMTAVDFTIGTLGLLTGWGFLGHWGYLLGLQSMANDLSPVPTTTIDPAEPWEQTAYVSCVGEDENYPEVKPWDVAVCALIHWRLNDPNVNHRLVINLQVDFNYVMLSLVTNNLEVKLTPGVDVSWYGRTYPDTHYYSFYQISTPYGTGYHIDTIGSSDSGYHILGWSKLTDDNTTDYKVEADGTIRVRGYFRQSDTLSPGLQPGRRKTNIYVMYSSNINNIVKTEQVLDYTDGTGWKYKDIRISGLIGGRSVKIGVGRADDWVSDWQVVAEWADVQVGEGTIEGVRFSLREQDTYHPNYNPDIRFLKPSSSVLRLDSYQAGTSSLGTGWAFVVVPRDWLNGRYIRFSWSGYFSYSQPRVIAGAYIYDGEYNRANDADFPEGTWLPSPKGAGLLQTLEVKNVGGSWGPQTVDVPANVAAGTQSKCTIFFAMGDGWVGQTVYLDIDWFEINQGAGGVGHLAVEGFDASVQMERIGTHGDYGYISNGDINP